MAKVITFGNEKGGVGKSACSISLSHGYAERGCRVMLVDADPQASIMEWRSDRRKDLPLHKNLAVCAMEGTRLHHDILSIAPHYDIIIIDTPGRMGKEAILGKEIILRSAAAVSNVIIIPCSYSASDIRSSKKAVNLLQGIRITMPKLKVFVLLNMIESTTSMKRRLNEKLAELLPEGINLMATELADRVIYEIAEISGQAVQEIDRDGLATKDINKLIEEIENAH